MTDLLVSQLLHYNSLGLIPGPSESPSDFAQRAEYCLTLKSHLSDELKNHLGTSYDISLQTLKDGFLNVQNYYDISPTWIPIFFSNYQLTPWHGGCAWIFQLTELSPTAALLQLRKSLFNSPKYLGIYHRQELVSHELTHVGRMMFNEPKFEEILAYHTSPSTFRKWLGPIIQSSGESMLFVFILGFIVLIDIFLLSFNLYHVYLQAQWLKLIPIALIVYALIRLRNKHNLFNNCLNSLTACLGNKQHSTHVIYRLQDAEITQFAHMSPSEIKEYATKAANSSLRWQVVNTAYFNGQIH